MINDNSKDMSLGLILEKLDLLTENITELSKSQTHLSAQLERLQNAHAEQQVEEILNARQASVFLGMTKNYLYKLVQAKAIPFHKPNGKFLYFIQSELCNWIKNECKVCDDNGVLYR